MNMRTTPKAILSSSLGQNCTTLHVPSITYNYFQSKIYLFNHNIDVLMNSLILASRCSRSWIRIVLQLSSAYNNKTYQNIICSLSMIIGTTCAVIGYTRLPYFLHNNQLMKWHIHRIE